jgi:hypothetical protein
MSIFGAGTLRAHAARPAISTVFRGVGAVKQGE